MRWWVRVNPQGCVEGTVSDEEARTEREAHHNFVSSEDQIIQEIAEGWTHRIVENNDYQGWVRQCLVGRCAHRTPHKEEGVTSSPTEECSECGHSIEQHDRKIECGSRWDVCEHPDCAEPRLLRWMRRERLAMLISKMERDVILPNERLELKHAILEECADTDRAWARAARTKRVEGMS